MYDISVCFLYDTSGYENNQKKKNYSVLEKHIKELGYRCGDIFCVYRSRKTDTKSVDNDNKENTQLLF